jgi:hypothetical protein
MDLRTEIEIDAPPAAVWRALTDFAAFPDWNPYIREANGDLRVGGKLRVRLQPLGSREFTFKPTVVAHDENRELRWVGHLGIPGLFDGEHSFRLEPIEGSRTRFVQSERFKGILVPLLARSLDRDTRRGFEEMNRALKQRAEGAR